MAMTAQVKAELASTTVTKSCCRKSEVSSMLRFAGGLHIVSGRIVVEAELDTEVVERPIDRTELYLAEEIWICGTGVEILPVTRIDHRPIGEGKIGPLAERVRHVFQDVVRGRNARYRSWLAPVYRSAAAAQGEAPKSERESSRAR